ncbi:MAG: hypothetical protein WA708_03645 [Acidobacteriaceae bacterium]
MKPSSVTLRTMLKRAGFLTLAIATAACLHAQTTSSSSSYNSNYNPNYNQTSNNQRAPRYTGHSWFDHWTLEGGGGVTPAAGGTQNYANTGFNVLLGGGFKFNDRLSVLAEWNFNRLGVPHSLAQVVAGVPDGNEHLWTIDVNPKFDLIHIWRSSLYVIGGGGFSRALVNYTYPVVFYCYGYYFGYPCSGDVTVAHSSSNQGNWDIGGGGEWRVSPYERGSIFLEARYERLLTPNNGLPPGPSASYIPVTLGYRW